MIHIALLWSANNQRIATIDIPLLWSGGIAIHIPLRWGFFCLNRGLYGLGGLHG